MRGRKGVRERKRDGKSVAFRVSQRVEQLKLVKFIFRPQDVLMGGNQTAWR